MAQRDHMPNYQGADITACAAGGVSVGTGFPDRPPLTLPLALGAHFASVAASAAILLATFGRDVTGRGQFVDVSETDVLAILLAGYGIPTYIYRGVTGIRAGRHMSLGLYPNAVFECQDGFVCIDCPQLAQWNRLLEVMGNPPWVNEPRYRDRRQITEAVSPGSRRAHGSLAEGARQGGDFRGYAGTTHPHWAGEYHERCGRRRASTRPPVLRQRRARRHGCTDVSWGSLPIQPNALGSAPPSSTPGRTQ